MFKLVYCVLILMSCSFFSDKKQTIPVKGYHIFWSDEFNGNDLDLTKWNYRTQGEGDFFTKEATKLDGKGHLVLNISKNGNSMHAGMIATENIINFTYGYFECRARFAHTLGTISDFWLLSPLINEPAADPATDGVELDIFEYDPHAMIDKVGHWLHWGGYGAKHQIAGPVWGQLSTTIDDFHTVGLEWTDTSYTTYVDGKKTYTGNTLISKVPEFIILSLGFNRPTNAPALEDFSDNFIIDYVRVYKKN